jgi:hypothetical protein
VRKGWFVPDFALVLTTIGLFYVLVVFGGSATLFGDSDSGWHIRTGERILATSSLPHTDPYSFSRAGEPWFAWEWGSDVLMGAAHRAARLRGVAFLFLVALGIALWMWFQLHWALGGDFLLACAMLGPMLTVTSLHWLARPHVFGWCFALGAVWAAERSPERFRWWHGALLFAGGVLWANMHASFFLGPVIFGIYAAGDFMTGRLRARWLALAALITAAASFVNPYGWHVHEHILRYLGNQKLLSQIAEFQPFNFHGEGAFPVVFVLFCDVFGALLALFLRLPGRAFLCLLLAFLGFRSARALPLAALILLPLSSATLSQALRGWSSIPAGLRKRLDGWLNYSAGLRKLDSPHSGILLMPLIALGFYWLLGVPGMAVRTGFAAGELPVAVAEQVKELPANVRIFAPDRYGGYLIYRFDGQPRVFFDGRSDFYGVEFIDGYTKILEARPGWQQEFERWGFTHALLPKASPLRQPLIESGWQQTGADSIAVLLTRNAE